eukprot:3116435-Rhodomonas_salina.2
MLQTDCSKTKKTKLEEDPPTPKINTNQNKEKKNPFLLLFRTTVFEHVIRYIPKRSETLPALVATCKDTVFLQRVLLLRYSDEAENANKGPEFYTNAPLSMGLVSNAFEDKIQWLHDLFCGKYRKFAKMVPAVVIRVLLAETEKIGYILDTIINEYKIPVIIWTLVIPTFSAVELHRKSLLSFTGKFKDQKNKMLRIQGHMIKVTFCFVNSETEDSLYKTFESNGNIFRNEINRRIVFTWTIPITTTFLQLSRMLHVAGFAIQPEKSPHFFMVFCEDGFWEWPYTALSQELIIDRMTLVTKSTTGTVRIVIPYKCPKNINTEDFSEAKQRFAMHKIIRDLHNVETKVSTHSSKHEDKTHNGTRDFQITAGDVIPELDKITNVYKRMTCNDIELLTLFPLMQVVYNRLNNQGIQHLSVPRRSKIVKEWWKSVIDDSKKMTDIVFLEKRTAFKTNGQDHIPNNTIQRLADKTFQYNPTAMGNMAALAAGCGWTPNIEDSYNKIVWDFIDENVVLPVYTDPVYRGAFCSPRRFDWYKNFEPQRASQILKARLNAIPSLLFNSNQKYLREALYTPIIAVYYSNGEKRDTHKFPKKTMWTNKQKEAIIKLYKPTPKLACTRTQGIHCILQEGQMP